MNYGRQKIPLNGVHISASGEYIERPVRGGDAALHHITLTTGLRYVQSGKMTQ